MRYSITLSYDGSSFFGWQVQPGAISVQECLEKALSTLLKEDISVTGAGRTDTKVNAIGYVAHFDSASEEPLETCPLQWSFQELSGRMVTSMPDSTQ